MKVRSFTECLEDYSCVFEVTCTSSQRFGHPRQAVGKLLIDVMTCFIVNAVQNRVTKRTPTLSKDKSMSSSREFPNHVLASPAENLANNFYLDLVIPLQRIVVDSRLCELAFHFCPPPRSSRAYVTFDDVTRKHLDSDVLLIDDQLLALSAMQSLLRVSMLGRGGGRRVELTIASSSLELDGSLKSSLPSPPRPVKDPSPAD
ncbi:hypothetical protein GN244_ATG19443 [Phytophthora infestans]|uniref:Uncharacterized protein n=1 Tax=Phytophthora infestans TaxID=4787 RepID=A0A833S4L5_PHYIN|nr:hypothetical protein GN244_ATG19443 [Phytophthora infestans]